MLEAWRDGLMTRFAVELGEWSAARLPVLFLSSW